MSFLISEQADDQRISFLTWPLTAGRRQWIANVWQCTAETAAISFINCGTRSANREHLFLKAIRRFKDGSDLKVLPPCFTRQGSTYRLAHGWSQLRRGLRLCNSCRTTFY